MQSVRAFSGANDGNEMLKGLRYFERAIQGKPGTEPKGELFENEIILMYGIILISNCINVKYDNQLFQIHCLGDR